ncbi:strawberry notch C-terminal domain-containing protein [Burkholderia cepacia]|uniref:Uncharacterized protein n=1 Tax=Burkholderia cepacia TaxID=292 RepID=A0AAX2RN27_BURCE|nr:strawberry notch C-terminal domain-containing protein [Burkholderia cepacia]TET01646.1 hypothetical protein E3D36_16560 [Burkholderia cepacia]TEU47504.1 hypothetical protein E3D37_15990 [Burkholderia cepacia]TEU53531.1 hypothetical protein E3D38_12380 [Burkholderia cepacia]TEV02137.1 hypothetical protein E3D40_13310 [Burkholderia cepacia]TEV07948.1 hypothetical protein E3D44_19310 [Burkholderia cepacia]
MTEKTANWIDLSAHGLKLSLVQFPSGERRAILAGVVPQSSDYTWALENGFERPANKERPFLILRGDAVPTSRLMARFKQAVVRKMPVGEILQVVSAPKAERVRQPVRESQVKDTTFLGLNHLGQSVFTCATGRFLRADDKSEAVTEGSIDSPALFLRATSGNDLALCADGLVRRMTRGEVLRSEDIRSFGATVHDLAQPMTQFDSRLRGVQEAIEAAVQRQVERSHGDPEAVFREAVSLLERQPPFIFRSTDSMILQQYSTPIPLALAAQHALGDTAGKKGLEPTVGNGSLVTRLPEGTEVIGVEIDAERARAAEKLRNVARVVTGDVTQTNIARLAGDTGFDFVIANPPFGGLDKPVEMFDMKVTRLDHLILMKSLAARVDDGAGVFIIGADRENIFPGKGGIVSGGSKNLFNWLNDHYETDIVEISGKLYAKQGASYPIRMVGVGPRRTPEEIERARATGQYRLKDRLPVLHSWDDVWNAATRMGQAIAPARVRTAENKAIDVAETIEATVEAAPQAPDQRSKNDYQTPYLPASSVGEPDSMIPRNLQAPVSRALERLQEEVGGVDEYVARSLQMTMEQLAEAFSPEQVDAVALAIHKIETNRGFISGDQTGMGKGRIAAAVARYGALNNIPVVFATEKANLFNDFWRDVRDIGSDGLFTPLLINDFSYIEDTKGKKIHKAIQRGVLTDMIAEGQAPSERGYNLTMLTYSQFSRERAKSAKCVWLPTVTRGAILIADEAHNAAGESFTAENFAVALTEVKGVVYSSATFAKGAKNFAIYSKAFPSSVNVDSMADTLEKGGEPMLEVLSAMLAEDGALIRREHDLSKLEFETYLDTANLQRNEDLANQLAPILSLMAYLGGDIERMVTKVNREIAKELKKLPEDQRKGKRMGVQATNFGSRLYTITRQFMLATLVDAAADLAAKDLREGRKPVFVLEQTFEGLAKELILEHQTEALEAVKQRAEDNAELGEDGDDIDFGAFNGDLRLPTSIEFRDVLRRTVDRLMIVSESNGYGKATKTSFLSIAQRAGGAEAVEATENVVGELYRMISEFPSLPVSPIDALRERIEASGWTSGEISGRKITMHSLNGTPQDAALDLDAGFAGVVVRGREDNRIRTIADFNNGRLDAVVLTRAGSTGISLHASEKFEDQRQRSLIELQIPNNVAERVQFFGRVNRKGQVVPPLIRTVASGLPAQERILAMQNTKLRKLSANTQSNRNNAAEAKDVADILNEIGDKVAREYLFNHPDIADTLGISLGELDQSDVGDNWFVNKLLGRISLVSPVAKQRQILDQLNVDFKSIVADLDRRGINPLRSRHLDLNARTVSTHEMLPGSDAGSAFDRPVFIRDIEYTEVIDPIRSGAVMDRISKARADLDADPRIGAVGGVESYRCALEIGRLARVSAFGSALESVKADLPNQGIAHTMLPEGKTLQDMLADSGENIVKSLRARVALIENHSNAVLPGRVISYEGEDGVQTGVVTDLSLPEAGRECYIGQYRVRIAIPGCAHQDVLSLKSLFESGLKLVYPQPTTEAIAQMFDAAPAGEIVQKRCLLDGNLYRASELAAKSGVGKSITYTDSLGMTQRGIMLPSKFDRQMLEEMVREVGNTMRAMRLVSAGVAEFRIAGLAQGDDERENRIELDGRNAIVQFKGVRNNVEALKPALDAVGVEAYGSRGSMRSEFPIADLMEFVDALLKARSHGGCGLQLEVTAEDSRLLKKVMQQEVDDLRQRGQPTHGNSVETIDAATGTSRSSLELA